MAGVLALAAFVVSGRDARRGGEVGAGVVVLVLAGGYGATLAAGT